MWLSYRHNTSYLITVATESHSDILGLNNSKLENTSLSQKPDILTPFLLCLCYIHHRFRMIKKPMYFPRSWFTGSSYIRNYDLFHKPTEQNYTDGIHFLFPEVTSTESYMLWDYSIPKRSLIHLSKTSLDPCPSFCPNLPWFVPYVLLIPVSHWIILSA